MTENLYRFIGVVLMVSAGVLGVTTLLHILELLPLGNKGPEWVAAIGTVGTLYVSIWLATSEQRRRHREAMEKGHLYAMGITLRINNAEDMVNRVCGTLLTCLNTPIELSNDHLKNMRYQLSEADIWKIDEVIPLAPLPGSVAIKLAKAADRVEAAIRQLDRASVDFQTLSSPEKLGFAQELYGKLSEAETLLRDASNTCRHGVNLQGQ